MFCKNCRNGLNQGDKFCPKCGTEVENNNSTKNVTPSPQVNTDVKKVKTGSIYLKVVIVAICLFFIFTILNLILKASDNTEYSDITAIYQTVIPILLIIFGWIPAMIYAHEANKPSTDISKLKKTFMIIAGVIAGIAVIVGIYLMTLPKYTCKSSEGNLTIRYKGDNIVSYIATDIDFDSDKAKEIAKEYGMDTYLKYLKMWFEEKTDGTCE